MLKVLLAHNFYQQSGGEDTVFSSEGRLLREKGHEVIEYIEHNDRIRTMNKLDVAAETLWSRNSYNRISDVLEKEKPDVVHFHNTFPLISPSAYYACRAAEIPVIQSLDNPRLICPSATFFRDSHLCQECMKKTPPWPSIAYGCYHNSRLQTSVVASMLTLHRLLNTWNEKVDTYLVATEFYRQKFIEGGIPASKITVKPHFISSKLENKPNLNSRDCAIFIARLDPEKGVRTMLSAWKGLNIPLKIRGEGQLEKEVINFIKVNGLNKIELLDRLSGAELDQLRKGARFLIWPSEGYYETFGLAAVECFASGTPVIASRIGVMTEIVTDGVTGLHFNPGDPEDLAAKVRWAWDHPSEMAAMGKNARLEYESKYTADKNYRMLISIYENAVHKSRGTVSG
jgi:glycosyltransferase involved in cell wall biosynthesis